MLLDTSSWVEFIRGTNKGSKIAESIRYVDVFTSVVTLSEFVHWCLKNNIRYENHLEKIKSGSRILDLDEDIAALAGRINYERKKVIKNWGMADSIILGTSIIHDIKIITTDHHFRDLSNVILV